MPGSFLGSGWAFPVRPENGRLQLVADEAAVERAVGLILLTDPGERLMLPGFGAGLRQFVFEPNAPATHEAIAAAVRRALTEWEPRIDLDAVTVLPDGADPGLLLIHLDYRVRATNTAFNRVYPFYLLEGGA